ncbi:HNH/ENDO VII family nuclease [Acinetobacter sp. GG2]|uniref:HNH/ENDO VII family nuclease n=1 Tax=Acinetobacter TaxID=469 RepID=UPI0039B6D293
MDPLGLTKIFNKKTTHIGTKTNIEYTVYQQVIDWDQKFTTRGGKTETNLDRALRGDAPRIKTANGWSSVNLHYSKQNANGPLFELSGNSHSKNTALPALHPYRPKQHPDYPVNRDDFNDDRDGYWKDRANKELERRNTSSGCPL